jgi:hypothetical protein
MQSRLEEREAELKSQFEERERELIELNQLTVRRMTDSDSKCTALQNSKLILSSSSSTVFSTLSMIMIEVVGPLS